MAQELPDTSDGCNTLVARERRLAASLDPSARAKRLAPTMIDMAHEVRLRMAGQVELADFYVERLKQSAELLRILDTEVYRLRQAIGCHRDGRLDSRALWRMSDGWNAPID